MKQTIACHDGKCFKVKKGIASFEDLFEPYSIVDKIEEELWKYNFYGS